jgi:hypothetical protein
VLESSFIGGHNQGLPIGLWSHRVPGSWRGLTSLIRVLPSDLGLLGTLVRASLDLVSAAYPSCHEPPVLLWLSLAFLSFLLALPDTLSFHMKPAYLAMYCRSPSSIGPWNCQLPVVVSQNYWLPVHRFARTASSPWWYARNTGSQFTGLLELLAPCDGMPELLAPREVTSINIKSRFLTTGESLPSVVLSASPGWLILAPS